MLPAEPPSLDGWEFAPYFEAAHQVGGDFYDYFPLPGEPGRWSIIIADVSDKGVPAALFMALSRTTLRNIALRGRPPAEVVAWANRFIQEDSQSDMFLTAFYAELNAENGRLTYANAGHDPPLIWRKATGQFQALPATCPLLGVIQELNVSVATVDLEPGDVLILYTDGVTEAIDEDYHEFGQARIEDTVTSLLAERPDASAQEIKEALADAVSRFAGSMVQYDDLTLLIIKRAAPHEDDHG
jgi:sigma-B regulation protein RsbU (phosphoserine phosphatase)